MEKCFLKKISVKMFVDAVIFYFIRNPSSGHNSSVSFIVVIEISVDFVNTQFLGEEFGAEILHRLLTDDT